MYVVVDYENDRVTGPFPTREAAEEWTRMVFRVDSIDDLDPSEGSVKELETPSDDPAEYE